MISLSHVYKTYYADRHALRDLSFTVQKGEFVFLTGASGAGKSTLFKLLTAQEKVTSGRIKVKNFDLNELTTADVAQYRTELGIVFQDYKLIKTLSVFDNIGLPLKIQNESNKEITIKVQEICEKLGLNDYLNELPIYLSGGEQQRISVARALIRDPQVLIADEPTGNLDKENSVLIMNLFKECALRGTTVFVATHDENLLAQQNDSRVISLDKGQLHKDVVR